MDRNEDNLHALQMLFFMDDNQRQLRRFLKGVNSDGPLHQLNQEWLDKQEFNCDLWLHGAGYQEEIEGKVFSISLQKDPIQVLKMGSLVGSCFGLGGMYAKSAAAVLLDVNKQVYFMYDEKGRFIARQQVAIDEDEKLVCHEVYPSDAKPETQRLFARFNLQLAKSLWVEIYSGNDPEIDFLLAQSMWVDWLLNPNTIDY